MTTFSAHHFSIYHRRKQKWIQWIKHVEQERAKGEQGESWKYKQLPQRKRDNYKERRSSSFIQAAEKEWAVWSLVDEGEVLHASDGCSFHLRGWKERGRGGGVNMDMYMSICVCVCVYILCVCAGYGVFLKKHSTHSTHCWTHNKKFKNYVAGQKILSFLIPYMLLPCQKMEPT